MENLSIIGLENCFKSAKKNRADYVAVKIEMEGFPEAEVIINPFPNIDTKLDCYKKTYDEDLNHKHAKGIRIVGYTYGYEYNDIEEDLVF